jgi:predicted Zn finger-like uncharacterized protein
LVTQCPTCRTRFRVTEVQLGVAGGRVRCGACLSVFTGVDNLVAGAVPRLRPGESADSALDALLDELRNETPAAARTAVRADKAPATPTPTAPKATRVPTAQADDVPEPLPEPEVESEAAPGDSIDDVIDTAQIDARDADIDLGAEEIDLDDVETADEELDNDATDVAAEEIELTPPVAPPPTPPPRIAPPRIAPPRIAPPSTAPPTAPPRIASESVPQPAAPPKPATARDGITSRPVKTRTETAPPPAVRPVRAALDLAVDPDALSVVPPPPRRWWVTPLLALCFGGLAALALYLQFGEWSRNPHIRPVYEFLCPKLGCRLPEMRALDKMVSKNLVVRANPEVASALLVDAIIVNEATFAQPFPDIELRFSALDGSPVKTHIYHPADYLAGELKGIKMIAPMTPVHIALDIEDPGPKAVNYVMAFR